MMILLKSLVLTIIFNNLGFHPTTLNVLVGASSCVRIRTSVGLGADCNLNRNVSNVTLSNTVYDNLTEINSTLAEISTLSVGSSCVFAIRRVLCLDAFPKCNETNVTLPSPSLEECQAVMDNCSELVAKTYASSACGSITPYNGTVCVDVKVNDSGYCPDTETYKIIAKDLSAFLKRQNKEKEMFKMSFAQAVRSYSTHDCVKTYREINCRSFVLSNCSILKNMTKEKCEQQLQCLPHNSTLNRTELCLRFPREKQMVNTTTLTLTSSTIAPTIDRSGFSYSNITVTVRLGNLKYNAEYGRKTSTLYKELSKNITVALTEVYKSISGFEGIEIFYLTCEQEVAVKHIVIINSKEMVNTTIIITKLNIANKTGFLKGKITAANETCGSGQSDNKQGTNWIYMIVFVIITALLLLAMVLCNQS